MSEINMDSLLDASLDDLADMPEFGTYPAGTHKVIIQWEKKEVNKHPSLELGMKAVETVELSNPTEDTPLAAGAEGSVLFMLDNEFSQGKLKVVLKQLAGLFGGGNIREITEASNGMEVTIVSKVRQNKDKTQSYTDLVKILA
jgi:hypothetical protein